MGTRIKKYRMKAIPSTFSEKGGFNAQFVGDGYTVDARTDILPSVITASGVQVGEGTAWELVTAFLKACADAAETPRLACRRRTSRPSSTPPKRRPYR